MSQRIRSVAVIALAASLAGQGTPLRWLATEQLGVLTPTASLAPRGLAGTDLGVSFPCGDRLVFLFGDSWTLDRAERDVDSFAWCKRAPLLPTGANRGVPELRWPARDGGRFEPLAVKGMVFGGMEVPVEGIVVGERTYVFFSSGWDPRDHRHSHSVCAHTKGHDFASLELDHRVATRRFVNVSIAVDGETAWIFGTGHYRKSSVFLARAAAAELDNRGAWRYWPDFGTDEGTAKPLVASNCIGELSVRRLADGGLWAMTCNAAVPRGIHLRTAQAPTGPWSDPVVIFDPSRDRGYGHTMHQKFGACGYDDGLSEPGRLEEWGGEYGPYLVPEWCGSPAAGVHELVYTLSTWNPYTVRLVRSIVAAPGATWTPPAPNVVAAANKAPRNLAFEGGKTAGWEQEGDAFAAAQRPDGTWFICTYVQPHGDTVTGRLSQEFVVPQAAQELRGVVSGGDEAVQLWRGDELLRCTRGVRSNGVDVPFRWRLDDLRGQRVRLVIADASTRAWGFVSVRGLELVE